MMSKETDTFKVAKASMCASQAVAFCLFFWVSLWFNDSLPFQSSPLLSVVEAACEAACVGARTSPTHHGP